MTALLNLRVVLGTPLNLRLEKEQCEGGVSDRECRSGSQGKEGWDTTPGSCWTLTLLLMDPYLCTGLCF